MRRVIAGLGSALVVMLLASCGPRGETKSLDEVLSIARARYEYVRTNDVPQDVRPALDKIGAGLQVLSKAPADDKANEVAEALSSLETRAAYTSRPAMAELVSQYRVLGLNSASKDNPARVKLLVSRTYHLLAAELETTHFSVS